jgi:hypothetical protein
MSTAKQITEELIEWHRKETSDETSYLEELMEDLEEILGSDSITIPSGEVELVEQFGGEGSGDDYWLVIKVGTKLFKVEGFHSSWEGANWDSAELKEVEAREVTVVKYFYK